jgi:UrcA family protein
MSRFFFATALGTGVALVLTASAFAAGLDVSAPDETAVVRIKASDSALHTRAGAAHLALQIRVAADHVCGADESPMARESNAFWRCRESAIDRATSELNAPLLAAALGRSPQVLAHTGH